MSGVRALAATSVVAGAAALAFAGEASAASIDVKLLLLNDASFSINGTEFDQINDACVDVFDDP